MKIAPSEGRKMSRSGGCKIKKKVWRPKKKKQKNMYYIKKEKDTCCISKTYLKKPWIARLRRIEVFMSTIIDDTDNRYLFWEYRHVNNRLELLRDRYFLMKRSLESKSPINIYMLETVFDSCLRISDKLLSMLFEKKTKKIDRK